MRERPDYTTGPTHQLLELFISKTRVEFLLFQANAGDKLEKTDMVPAFLKITVLGEGMQ